jgi:hypothetical protein
MRPRRGQDPCLRLNFDRNAGELDVQLGDSSRLTQRLDSFRWACHQEERGSLDFLAKLSLPHLVIRQDGRFAGDAELAPSMPGREHDEIGVPAVLR